MKMSSSLNAFWSTASNISFRPWKHFLLRLRINKIRKETHLTFVCSRKMRCLSTIFPKKIIKETAEWRRLLSKLRGILNLQSTICKWDLLPNHPNCKKRHIKKRKLSVILSLNYLNIPPKTSFKIPKAPTSSTSRLTSNLRCCRKSNCLVKSNVKMGSQCKTTEISTKWSSSRKYSSRCSAQDICIDLWCCREVRTSQE